MNEGINRSKLEELPLWARDAKNAMHAYNLVHKAALDELGEFMDGKRGKLEDEYEHKVRVLLYGFMRQVGIDKLPEKVLLEKTTSSPGFTLNAGSLGQFNLGSRNAQARYFLPRESCIYRIYLDELNEKGDLGLKFNPEEPAFIGFDKIKNLKDEKIPLGIYKDIIRENNPARNESLDKEEINIIINAFKEFFTGSVFEASVVNLVNQLDQIDKEFLVKLNERMIYHAEREKHRILQLKRAIASGIKLPKYIKGNSVNIPKPGELRYHKTLITDEDELKIIPFYSKNTILGGNVQKPDMTKQKPAEITDWLRSLIYSELKNYLPENIKEKIDEELKR